jgi:protein-S-isoprenylcysteine O-methyltransferase Ste14
MLIEYLVASFLVAFLTIFLTVNLFNAIRTIRHRSREKGKSISSAKANSPNSFLLVPAILGTFTFFLEAAAYPVCVFLESCQSAEYGILQITVQHSVYMQAMGASLISIGCALFLWSILERSHQRNIGKLVIWGPFRYVRHPSYLGYFLMFLGLPLLLLNVATLMPLIAIPGYIGLTDYEEQLLIKEFNDEYIEYQRTTGRFIPKF